MTLKTNCTPRSRDKHSLSAAISPDLTSVAQAIAFVGSGILEESAAPQVGELVTSEIAQKAKILLGIQRYIQSLVEDGQKKTLEQNVYLHLLKPLVRHLLDIRFVAESLIEDENDLNFIINPINEIFGYFSIEIIKPEIGDRFDSNIMKLRISDPKQKTSDMVVHKLWEHDNLRFI